MGKVRHLIAAHYEQVMIYGNRAVFDPAHQGVERAHVGAARLPGLAERPQVHARAERLVAGAGDDDGAHVVVLLGGFQGVAQTVDQGRAQGVAGLGPVQGQHEHGVHALGQKLVPHHAPRLATICGRSNVVRMPGAAAQT